MIDTFTVTISSSVYFGPTFFGGHSFCSMFPAALNYFFVNFSWSYSSSVAILFAASSLLL